ncbi:MAG: class I SAM-dependent methyltransferase [Acidimicrobiales bacterium]
MDVTGQTRRYWDDDAPTYDRSPRHRPTDPLVRAAWLAAVARLLPDPPARVLDCGAGTGFVSLMAARLGHRVTALDLSPGMLAQLRRAAEHDGVEVEAVEGLAEDPPGPFDVVIERHLVWTLPDPGAALRAWRAAAPVGRLVLLESLWGDGGPAGRLRAAGRRALRLRRGLEPEHHAPYPAELRAALPLGSGTPPDRLLAAVTGAGWPNPRVERLRDVEWAEGRALGPLERLAGVSPRFAVVAG